MAHGSRHDAAGYSESSHTPLRHYGHAAAWTGTPPASSPPASPEPLGRAQCCLTVIGEMPGIRRRVAYLRFHEGWTNRMIASIWGLGRARWQNTYPMRALT